MTSLVKLTGQLWIEHWVTSSLSFWRRGWPALQRKSWGSGGLGERREKEERWGRKGEGREERSKAGGSGSGKRERGKVEMCGGGLTLGGVGEEWCT